MHKVEFKRLVLLLCLFSVFHVNAQEKYEKESRLKENEVPKPALEFIEKLHIEKRVKWYLEEGLEEFSVEAKYSFQGAKYSVEFDTVGRIQDVEVRIKWKEVPSAVRNAISSAFEADCNRFQIRKIQIQFVGEASDLHTKLNGEEVEEIRTNYELVVKCRSARDVNLYEYLFDHLGSKLKVSRIVFKNSSHLEY